jgi:hypothetical protein
MGKSQQVAERTRLHHGKTGCERRPNEEEEHQKNHQTI